MRVTVLGSGSRGNALLVEAKGTRILVDAGLTPTAVKRRSCRTHGEPLTHIDGIVVTHAHGDHCSHAAALSDAFCAPVYLTESTRRTMLFRSTTIPMRIYGARAPFRIGAIAITPVPVPHDAPQVALAFESDGCRIGMVTDAGEVTADLVAHLRGCSTVLVESNYDPYMLERGPYPASLKRRIASARGHLANEQTAELLRALDERTKTIVLLHLSETNNRPELAFRIAKDALRGRDVDLFTAHSRKPLRVSGTKAAQLTFDWSTAGTGLH